jgi:hypothetical protein
MNKTELTTETAAEIARWHHEAQTLADQAKDNSVKAMQAAVACGGHINSIKGMGPGRKIAWLRDNVPDINPERAKAYMTLEKVARKRESQSIDHRQLILLGVVGEQRRDSIQSRFPKINAGKWIRAVADIVSHFRDAFEKTPLEDWPEYERESVARQLKPIAEIYEQLVNQR